MKTVVITGSTRGIGFGMATEFLKRGHQLIFCGRSQDSVNKAEEELAAHFQSSSLIGQICDVNRADHLEDLWNAGVEKFGQIDIWINNAGVNHPGKPFGELDQAAYQNVVLTNLVGTMNGCQVATKGMLKQNGGFIYNMEGLGSDGRVIPGISAYGASKRGLSYFTDVLIKEYVNSPVKIGMISPGMVVTDLLVNDERRSSSDWERTKEIFNILADHVETVTPFLVDEILKNDRHGKKIAWLTTPKIIWRFLASPFQNRQIIE